MAITHSTPYWTVRRGLPRIAKLLFLASLVVVVSIYLARTTLSTVVVEQTFPASIHRVWTLWNDPVAISQWRSPKKYTAPVIRNDLRVGGQFLFSLKSESGDMDWTAGEYQEVILEQRTVAIAYLADESGRALPGSQQTSPGEWPDELRVTTEFMDLGGRTQVRVTEEGIPLIMKLWTQLAWREQFEKFEKLLR